MRLNEELLEKVEEFFDHMHAVDMVALDFAMNSLRHFLERDVDGWTSHTRDELIRAVAERAEEIWNLIPEEDREDSDLSESYDELLQMLSEEDSCSEGETNDEVDLEEEEPWD